MICSLQLTFKFSVFSRTETTSQEELCSIFLFFCQNMSPKFGRRFIGIFCLVSVVFALCAGVFSSFRAMWQPFVSRSLENPATPNVDGSRTSEMGQNYKLSWCQKPGNPSELSVLIQLEWAPPDVLKPLWDTVQKIFVYSMYIVL